MTRPTVKEGGGAYAEAFGSVIVDKQRGTVTIEKRGGIMRLNMDVTVITTATSDRVGFVLHENEFKEICRFLSKIEEFTE